MLTLVKPAASAAEPAPVETTPLFGLPLGRPGECGGCARFKALNPFQQVSGRCTLGLKPGIINRRTTACGLYRPRGVPAKFQGRAVRP